MMRPAHRKGLHREAGKGDDADQHGQRGDLGQDVRTEARQLLMDEGCKRQVPDGKPEKGGNPEIADAGHEGERGGGRDVGTDDGKHDGAQRHGRRRPGGAGRLEQIGRHLQEPGPQSDVDDRRMLHAVERDDSATPEQRVRGAGRRREAEDAENGAGRAEQLQEGERGHLRRDHQRKQHQEGERPAAGYVGEARGDRHGAADDKRRDGAEERGVDRMERGPDRGSLMRRWSSGAGWTVFDVPFPEDPNLVGQGADFDGKTLDDVGNRVEFAVDADHVLAADAPLDPQGRSGRSRRQRPRHHGYPVTNRRISA